MDTLTAGIATKLRQDEGIDEVVPNGARSALAAVESVRQAPSAVHPVLGPAFVTKQNVGKTSKFAANGTR